MQFEWDEEKEKLNIAKHGIDFRTAALVFHDDRRIEKYDHIHSTDEDRYITIGMIHGVPVIVMVVYNRQRRRHSNYICQAGNKKGEGGLLQC